MKRRTTCLYCEQDDIQTPLVSAGGRRVCPIHSKDWVEAHRPPTFRDLLKAAGIAPELMDKGIRRT